MPDEARETHDGQGQAVIISPARPMRRSAIKNLIAQLPERGKIKIGAKGKMRKSNQGNEFQPPIKLDHFRITTLRRLDDGNLERDEAIHQRLGDEPTEIPVRLLYDDPELNFPTRYAAFVGRTLWCSGDGESAMRLTKDGKDRFEIGCPCRLSDPSYQPKRGDPPRCKMNGSLSVVIDGASGLGGVWKFRTTSYNSITGIMGAMIFVRSITGGPLANIPLKLRVQPKQATAPTDGSPVLIYIVSLEFDGAVEDLQRRAHQIALDRATTHVSIAEIETEARRMLALAAPANAPLHGDEPEDIVAEFYPEQMMADDASQPPRRRRSQARGFMDDAPTEHGPGVLTDDLDTFADSPANLAAAIETAMEPTADDLDVDDLLVDARDRALRGRDVFREWYTEALDDEERLALRPHVKELQGTARRVDEQSLAVEDPTSAGDASPTEHPEGR